MLIDYWISTIFKGIKIGTILQIVRAYPIKLVVYPLIGLFPSLIKARIRYEGYTREKTKARLQRQTDRRDFIT